ncbi:hypothetical protein BYT27DRAFT_6440550 [Phlegmacium glaucopus]|nr:hypothetical protein BYT27DRAFT_6440550 [Phlegmacium glaucopus]
MSNICIRPDPVVRRQLNELQDTILLGRTSYREYRKMTRDFFTDQARSKSYYRDKSKYTELAVMLLQYLARHRSLGLERDSSTIVQEIFSRCPREPRLVTFLRSNQVPDDLKDRQNIVLAIKAYIKVNLSNFIIKSSFFLSHLSL